MAELTSSSTIIILLLLHALSLCSATVYTVGDTSGWDISTNLDTWVSNKIFNVGDTLLFQYSQYHTLCEATKENFDSCNTTNVMKSYSDGNTSIPLTSTGDRYFFCGHTLHCLGGLKLQVHVTGNETASPVGSPQPQPQSQPGIVGGGYVPPGSTKTYGPNSSATFNALRVENLLVAVLGFIYYVAWCM